MPNAGNSFDVSLENAHLDWGSYRSPTNRAVISGEAYIAIPKAYAVSFGIFNSNNPKTGLGYNEFIASSKDGFLKDVILLAQGCSSAGDPYAKQFSVKGNLKMLGDWFTHCGATTNNRVKVTFTSSTSLILEVI